MDEILALEQEKIKFAKRKLRVQRCKATTSASTPARKKTEKRTASSSSPQKGKTPTGGTITNPRSSGSASVRIPTPRSIPKGDQNLGKQLEHLSKEQRKQEKAANAERVARRLAKKQVKAAMAKEKSKFRMDGKGKERARVRRKGEGSGASSAGKKATKPRVRSEANLAKWNMKK